MDNSNVYRDIQTRTGGEIHIGAVGSVRISRSTLIKRFAELLVLPVMEDENLRNLSRDELLQSAVGKTIMTMESKFISKEAASINLADGIEAKVRVIDCVGFVVNKAAEYVENSEGRLVKTLWFDCDVLFTQATEVETRKVVSGHSTIRIVVITDGTTGGIKRPGYITAEKQTIDELKRLSKSFVVLLNSTKPHPDETARLAREMSELYGVPILPVSCEQLEKEDASHTLGRVLKEFPVAEMGFHTPKRLEILPPAHWLKVQVIQAAKDVIQKVAYMKGVPGGPEQQHADTIRFMNVRNIQMADDRVGVQMGTDNNYYYQILNDYVGLPVEGEYQLMQTLNSPANMRKEYERVQNTSTQMRLKEYGVVTPERSEIVLDESQVTKHGDKYGVKMKTEVPSINLIKAHIETEIVPIMGSEQQAQDLIAYIKENARESDDRVWNTNVLGKSIEQIVEDGTQTKVSQMMKDYQLKPQGTLQKIINDSSGGMIYIII